MSRTISVVVAAFAAERWLAECVESVQRQELPPGWRLELLVGVDGCAATAAAARKLDRRHLTVLQMSENNGPYVTFNTVMQMASGELIGRFDADDVMLPGYLARNIENLAEVEWSTTWSIFTDAELQPTSHILAAERLDLDGGKCRTTAHGQFVIRRRVWEALGGFRPWRCAADTDLLQRAAAFGFAIGTVEEFLYYRRTHPGSLTADPATGHLSELRRGYREFLLAHESVYASSPESLWVEPVTAEVFVVG